MPKITGVGRVTQRLQRLPEHVEELLDEALSSAGDRIKARAQHLISTQSASGQEGGKHGHVRSKPGDPPNEEFGDLRNGIRVTQPGPLRVRVEATAPHSVPLEFGTSKMAARPFMGPAARDTREEVVALVRAAVNHANKKK
jgi:phage protein, HK97 gp10 family